MGNNPYNSSFEKRKAMKFSIIQILPFFVISCVSEVDISLNETKKEISVNCILTPDADTVTAWLSYTKPVLHSVSLEFIRYSNGFSKLFLKDFFCQYLANFCSLIFIKIC